MSSVSKSLPTRLAVLEKTNYLFKNWRHARAGSVVFPGCGFPSFFPETLRALESALGRVPDVGFAYDCCGLPLSGLVSDAAAGRELDRVNTRLSRVGAREVVALCPNCSLAFDGALSCGLTTIYAKLRELARAGFVSVRTVGSPGAVFVPCPDREARAWLSDLEPFLGAGVFASSCNTCCGAAFELGSPAASDAAARRVLASIAGECAARGIEEPIVYVYCASCAGKLERARRACKDEACRRVRVVHALSALLGVEETPAVSLSVFNRARKAWR